MLTLRNLTTGYGTKSVSKNLNATLQEGQLTCLIGPNYAPLQDFSTQ